MYRCPKCGYLTNDKTAFEKHVTVCGNQERIKSPPVCPQEFKLETEAESETEIETEADRPRRGRPPKNN